MLAFRFHTTDGFDSTIIGAPAKGLEAFLDGLEKPETARQVVGMMLAQLMINGRQQAEALEARLNRGPDMEGMIALVEQAMRLAQYREEVAAMVDGSEGRYLSVYDLTSLIPKDTPGHKEAEAAREAQRKVREEHRLVTFGFDASQGAEKLTAEALPRAETVEVAALPDADKVQHETLAEYVEGA